MSQCVYTCHPTLQPVQIGLSPEGCRALLRTPARGENPSPDTAVCHISISSGLGISSLHCPSSPGADISPAPPAGAVPPLSWPDCLHFWAGECGKRMGKAGSKCGCEWHLQPMLASEQGTRIWFAGSVLEVGPAQFFLWCPMIQLLEGAILLSLSVSVMPPAHNCLQNLLLPSASTTSCGSCCPQH